MGSTELKTLETLGIKALEAIKDSQPPSWLAAPPDLARDARTASQYLFSQIVPHTPKCPLPSLLTDNFDAEQIWQQIDLQAQPLLSSLKHRLKTLHKISTSRDLRLLHDFEQKPLSGDKEADDAAAAGVDMEGADIDDAAAADVDMEGADIDAASDEEEEPSDEVEEPSQSEDSQEEEDDKDGKAGGVEDRFLKINDLEKFLEEAEHQSFEPSNAEGENTDDDDEDEDEVEDEGDDMGEEETGDDSEKGAQHEKSAKRPRYEDFFGGKKKAKLKRSSASLSESDDMESGDDNNSDDEHDEKQPKEKPSKHERQMEKIHKKMKELEKANLETKSWTMQGEVTAAKRPKNSALEVELEFEHNMRPAPVITEEVTASLEDIIKHRIVEEHFDDVQRKPALPSTAPKERIELDENKSERGLAEIYESEYMQKTGLAAAPTSSSDALKKEAALLFKRLCVKLDALSHFQFTPKPVIEDMSIQANVPALAMEEVAPMAVSEASMLAPEELFSGEGVVKEEGELTREDRKRLRAKKKRKLRAENSNKEIKKKRQLQSKDEEHGDQERRPKQQKRAQTHYGKSSKVFADLDLAMVKGSTKLSQKKTDVRNPSFLKL